MVVATSYIEAANLRSSHPRDATIQSFFEHQALEFKNMTTKFRAIRHNGSWYVGEFQVSNGYFLGIVSDDCECQARAEDYAEQYNREGI